MDKRNSKRKIVSTARKLRTSQNKTKRRNTTRSVKQKTTTIENTKTTSPAKTVYNEITAPKQVTAHAIRTDISQKINYENATINRNHDYMYGTSNNSDKSDSSIDEQITSNIKIDSEDEEVDQHSENSNEDSYKNDNHIPVVAITNHEQESVDASSSISYVTADTNKFNFVSAASSREYQQRLRRFVTEQLFRTVKFIPSQLYLDTYVRNQMENGMEVQQLPIDVKQLWWDNLKNNVRTTLNIKRGNVVEQFKRIFIGT